MRVTATELWLIGIVLGLFLLAMLFLACSMNPRGLLGLNSSNASRRRRRRGVNLRNNNSDEDDEEGGVDITFPTISEYIFDSQSGEAGFVAMEDGDDDGNIAGERQPLTMNHVFPDLLAEE